MRLEGSVHRLLFGIVVGCSVAITLNAGKTQAQIQPSPGLSNEVMANEVPVNAGDSLTLLPLTPISVTVSDDGPQLAEIADEMNTDGTRGKGGDIGWVRKDQAFSPAFDKDFADFIYKNRTGSVQVVETICVSELHRHADQLVVPQFYQAPKQRIYKNK